MSVTRNWSTELRSIGDTLVGLSLTEAQELSDYLREVHSVEAPAVTSILPPPPIIDPTPPLELSRTVYLEEFDSSWKINLIKEIRDILELGLKDSKAFVESVPAIVAEDLPLDEAEALAQRLEAVGGRVSLRE